VGEEKMEPNPPLRRSELHFRQTVPREKGNSFLGKRKEERTPPTYKKEREESAIFSCLQQERRKWK